MPATPAGAKITEIEAQRAHATGQILQNFSEWKVALDALLAEPLDGSDQSAVSTADHVDAPSQVDN